MSRQYEDVCMPLAETMTLLHPERALLKWEGFRNRSDIGQICYLTRDTSSAQRTRHTFDHRSFSSERTKVVRLLVTQLSEHMTLGAWFAYKKEQERSHTRDANDLARMLTDRARSHQAQPSPDVAHAGPAVKSEAPAAETPARKTPDAPWLTQIFTFG